MAKPYTALVRIARACEKLFGIPIKGDSVIYEPLLRIAQAVEKTQIYDIDNVVLSLVKGSSRYGYLYNDVFYEDKEYTKVIEASKEALYVDVSENPGIYIWDGSSYVAIGAGGGGSSDGKFVGYVTNDTSQSGTGIYVNALPTTRLDGSPLQNEDSVRVHASATLPMTIAGVTFGTRKAIGYYYNSGWMVQEGIITETTEVLLKNKATESISGTAQTQAQDNAEFVTEFGKKVDRVVTEDSGAKSIIDNQKGQHGAVMQSDFGNTIVSFNTADENGEDGIVAQVYAKSKDTNQGTRLNIKKTGMFYGKGTSASTEASEEIATLGDVDKRVLQLATMPTASATYLNKIVQFTGTTDTTYTNGYFYTVYLDGTTYKWKNVPVQTSESGDKKNAYASIKQHSDYLFETQYTQENMDQEYAYNVFSSPTSDELPLGACTGVYYNKRVLRMYDWYYDNLVDFLVRVAPEDVKGKHGSVAMCGAIPYFTKDAVGKETYNEKYKIVPFTVIDGINDKGLFFQQNVVPKKTNDINITHTSTEYKGKITTNMIGRILLDNCASVSEVAAELAKYDITRPTKMPAEYDSHYLICDSTGAHKIIEFAADGHSFQLVSFATNYEVMTNFNVLNGGISTDEQLTLDWNIISNDSAHNAGLERWELCVSELTKSNPSLESLRSRLNYTNAYLSSTSPFWYTEYCGMENEEGIILSPYLAKTHPEKFTQTVLDWQDKYNNRTREAEGDDRTWQTVHSVIYDLATGSMELSIQERDDKIETLYFNNEKEAFVQYVEIHPESGSVPEEEVSMLKNDGKIGIVYEYDNVNYLMDRVVATDNLSTSMVFLCAKKNDSADKVDTLITTINCNAADPSYRQITAQLIPSATSVIPDEKTIVINALGKVETKVGGYDETSEYTVFQDAFTRATNFKFVNTLLTSAPFKYEEPQIILHLTGTISCEDYAGEEQVYNVDSNVAFNWAATNTYKSSVVGLGCSFTIYSERAEDPMTVTCDLFAATYDRILSCNVKGVFNGTIKHKVNVDYLPLDNVTIAKSAGNLCLKNNGIQFSHLNSNAICNSLSEFDPSEEKLTTESVVYYAMHDRQRVITISDTQPLVAMTKDLWAKKVTTEVIMHSGNKVVDYTPYKLEQNFVRYSGTTEKDYTKVFYTANGTAEVTEYSVKLSGGEEYLYEDITDAYVNAWIASGEISPCPPSSWVVLTTGTNGFAKNASGAYEFMDHWAIHINSLVIENAGIMDSGALKPWDTITVALMNEYIAAENVVEAGSLAAGEFLCYTTGNATNKYDRKNHFTVSNVITFDLYIYAESLWRKIGTADGSESGGFIPDSVTINLNSLNKLQIKDGGVTKAKLATDLIATEIDEDSTNDKLPTAKAVTDKLYNLEVANFKDEAIATEGQLAYEESTDEKIPTCLAVQHYAKNYIASWKTAMPYAGSDYEDRIIQYTGEDTVEFVNGRFYRCVNSTTEGYKWKEVMVNEIKDTLESQLVTAALSANQGYVLKGLIDGMAGVVKVSVVATQPASPANNTIYYIGTAAPYAVKLYTTDDGWTDLGTTEIDLSEYSKIADIVDNCESTATNKPLSANQGKLIKDVLDKKLKTSYKITAPTTLDQFFTDCNFEDDEATSSHGYAVSVANGILPLDESACDFQLWQQDKDNRSIIVIIKDGKMYNKTKQSGSWDEGWTSYVNEGTATVDITAKDGANETKLSVIAGDGAYINDNKILTAGNSTLVDSSTYVDCTRDVLLSKLSSVTSGAMLFSNVRFAIRESPNGSNACSYSVLVVKKDASNCTILCQYAYEADTFVCAKYSGGWQSWVKLLNPNDTAYVKVSALFVDATRQRMLDIMSSALKHATLFCDVNFTTAESPDGKSTSRWTGYVVKRYPGFATYLMQRIFDGTTSYAGDIFTCACNDGVFSNWKQVRMTDNNTFSTLTVTGATALKGTTTVSEALTCSKTLKVAGTATMAAITSSGAISTTSSLTVNGSSTLAAVTASGAMVVNNTFKATGTATLGNTLTVSGKATINNALAVTGAATISGAATLSSNLTVGGSTKTSTLTVTGDSNVNLLQSSNKLVVYGSQPSIVLKTTTDERTDIYIKNKSDQIFAAIRIQANDALEIGRMRDGVWYDGAEVILRKNGNFEIRSNDGSNVGVLKGVGNALYWNSKRIG